MSQGADTIYTRGRRVRPRKANMLKTGDIVYYKGSLVEYHGLMVVAYIHRGRLALNGFGSRASITLSGARTESVRLVKAGA